MSSSEIKKMGITLRCGGARVAFTRGVLNKLLEVNHLITYSVFGTSADSIIAITCAYGLNIGGSVKVKELRDLDNRFRVPLFIFSFDINSLKP